MISSCIVDSCHLTPKLAFDKRGTDVYVCSTCGCIMCDLSFVHEQYEQANYYTIASHDLAAVESEWGFRWRYMLRQIRKLTAEPHTLDVGAGNGYFVSLAQREFGFDAHGVEVSDAEIAYAREVFGVHIGKAGSEDLSHRFNVVTSFNVVEHVKQPLDLLVEMNRYLTSDGYLVVTTPSPACIHRRLKGLTRWGMVCPPHHINLFTRAALQGLLARAGFEVQSYRTISAYIRFVRKFDVLNVLRNSAFYSLMALGLGADHMMICRKIADR